jgi:hypothetical protein
MKDRYLGNRELRSIGQQMQMLRNHLEIVVGGLMTELTSADAAMQVLAAARVRRSEQVRHQWVGLRADATETLSGVVGAYSDVLNLVGRMYGDPSL